MAATRIRRDALELRPLFIELGTLPHDQHDGSALVSMGPVKALVAVSGPSEVRIRDEKTDCAALDVHYTALQGMSGGTSSTSFSHAVEVIAKSVLLLHHYPRSLVSLHLNTYASPAAYVARPLLSRKQAVSTTLPPLQPPHPDAAISVALQAAHINAVTCACLDAASVGMRGMVAAVSAAVLRKGVRANLMAGWRAGEVAEPQETMDSSSLDSDSDDGDDFEIVLDPSPYEESLARSTHVAAFAFTRQLSASQAEQAEIDTSMESSREADKRRGRNALRGTLVYNSSQGSYAAHELINVLALCRSACKDITLEMRKAFTRQRMGDNNNS